MLGFATHFYLCAVMVIGVKPFKCDQCDYSTVERSHLKVHIRVHTGCLAYSEEMYLLQKNIIVSLVAVVIAISPACKILPLV